MEKCGEGGARDNAACVSQHWRDLPSSSSRDNKAMVCRETQKVLTENVGACLLANERNSGGRLRERDVGRRCRRQEL